MATRLRADIEALHYAVGLFAADSGRRAVAAAALLSFELEFSGRFQWLRRLLPLARFAGLPAVLILSVHKGGFPHYHLLSDLPRRSTSAASSAVWKPRSRS